MGLVHPIHVIGKVNGKYRALDAIQIPSAEPGSDHIEAIGNVMTLLKMNSRYIARDLEYAESMSDDEWARDMDAELKAAEKRLQDSLENWDQDPDKIKLKQGLIDASVSQFPSIHTCLLIGVFTARWQHGYIRNVQTRPWNAPPDWGGGGMWEPGCTIIDITGPYSCAMVLPFKRLSDRVEPELYRKLRLRPLDGHDWLKSSGREDRENPDEDRVRIKGEEKATPVTSPETISGLWPWLLGVPPSVRPNSEDDGSDHQKDEARNGDRNEGSYAEELPALETQVMSEILSGKVGSGEGEPPPPKRKRAVEPIEDEQRVWDVLERLLDSWNPKSLRNLKGYDSYRSCLKRFLYEYPEQFTHEHEGAVPLILTDLTSPDVIVKDLDLHQFRDLSGPQVVELVRGALRHNEAICPGEPRELDVLDVSFNRMLQLDDIGIILEVTSVDNFVCWHNPGLPPDEIAQISKGRIRKLTTRAGFLAPLEKFAITHEPFTDSPVPYEPAPIVSPSPVRIRQVMYMMLGTTEVDAGGPRPDLADQLLIPEGGLSLELVDPGTLAVLLHPKFHCEYFGVYLEGDKNKAHAQLVALPTHDVWVPLAEFYNSIARFERFMSHESFVDSGVDCLSDRWPLAFALALSQGNERCEHLITAPLPPEAFSLTTRKLRGVDYIDTPSLFEREPQPIVDGEYTLLLLREPDYGRLRLGMATRTAEGELVVRDPEAVAREAGDEKAARAWGCGIGALPPWTGCNTGEREASKAGERNLGRDGKRPQYRYSRNTALLKAKDFSKILAANEQLSTDTKEKRIWHKIKEIRKMRTGKNSG